MSSSIKSYFEHKRRDLSNKSSNQQERKKIQKEQLYWIYCSAKKEMITLLYLSKEKSFLVVQAFSKII